MPFETLFIKEISLFEKLLFLDVKLSIINFNEMSDSRNFSIILKIISLGELFKII